MSNGRRRQFLCKCHVRQAAGFTGKCQFVTTDPGSGAPRFKCTPKRCSQKSDCKLSQSLSVRTTTILDATGTGAKESARVEISTVEYAEKLMNIDTFQPRTNSFQEYMVAKKLEMASTSANPEDQQRCATIWFLQRKSHVRGSHSQEAMCCRCRLS